MHWEIALFIWRDEISCHVCQEIHSLFCFRSHEKERRLEVFNTCRTDHHLNLTRSKGGSGTLLMCYGWTVKVHLNQNSECFLGLFILFLFPFWVCPLTFFGLFHRSSLVHLHVQQCFQRYRAAPVSISCQGICIYWGAALFVMPLGELCCSFMASVLHFASEPAFSLSYRIDLFVKINPHSWCTPDKNE